MNAFTRFAEPQWYLIQTKARQEARAEEHLRRQHLECYRPVKADAKGAEQALFPGYLFLRMAPTDSWFPIRSTRGVARVVAFGPAPCAVPEALVEQVRQRLAGQPPLRAGEPVRVQAGSGELQAIFLCNDGDQRAMILLNLLQRQQRVSLPRERLTRLATAC
ncbi:MULTISPECIES: transcription termination/antitermination NusG family protein [unclassified Pseudomonas]|uniref:transcription termination/antitermination NusG family protein n=1 Tax=unclassified Pseudomonas TaxID=196821 RepID=UPI000BC89B9E|nr:MULTISPECIES: transcription termination/antitermination NusG family protein [unclassified Pseudomonas]PVZ15712.1 transcriptional antiterminator RfaH [Pseudomonas sp. URIL14HWK12:I12]PVZ25086.1 transcriptional antiterminator RfaH [Pseudomonas sp. URIL14HWK12:I10]PVZ34932.1 transcriptional antiterminator RfaH [Pseudomonas sp. URIL14HWK12:I11]SNZ09703.1 transcriptional antiterminator RfaH [Pseudomonas sp. URIL14HWK12:I9]